MKMNSQEVLENWKYLTQEQRRKIVIQQDKESRKEHPEHYD